MSAHTAILLFSRNRFEEAKAKRFAPSRGASEALAGELIRQTRETAGRTGLPLFVVDSSQQVGNNFGERLSFALEEVFSAGFERVIAIGNDCPGLKESDILQASRALSHNQMVLGPALDGGVWLLGLRREAFTAESLQNIPWETSEVYASLFELALRDEKRLFLLRSEFDLDSRTELEESLPKLRQIAPSLGLRMRALLAPKPNFSFASIPFPIQEHLSLPQYRGPPSH